MSGRPPRISTLRAQDLSDLSPGSAEKLIRELQLGSGENNQFARETNETLDSLDSRLDAAEADIADHETRIEDLEGGGTSPVEVDRTTGDIAYTSTTPATITGFETAVAADGVVSFRGRLQWHTFVAATGIQVQIGTPASPARVTWAARLQTGGTSEAVSSFTSGAATSFGTYATATPVYVEFHGQIINGSNAGNVSIQIASTNGSEITLNAGSWVEWFG